MEEEDFSSRQNLTALKPLVVEDEGTGGQDLNQDAKSDSLYVTSGSLRISTEDIVYPVDDTISVYEVKKGDTLSTVAGLYGVSKNTIMWANDLKSEKISLGDTLIILPITGIRHTVKKGDTISTIAKKYKADIEDITSYNGFSKSKELAIGDVIIVPDGEIVGAVPSRTVAVRKSPSYLVTAPAGFLVRPLVGGAKTQGIHGNNGIDIGAKSGTSVVASASGRVIAARSGGYNGGYGSMIIISHASGIQTLYAHLRAVYVTQGQEVSQGEVIGEVGNTGRSTGSHLHFEVRGAKNPF